MVLSLCFLMWPIIHPGTSVGAGGLQVSPWGRFFSTSIDPGSDFFSSTPSQICLPPEANSEPGASEADDALGDSLHQAHLCLAPVMPWPAALSGGCSPLGMLRGFLVGWDSGTCDPSCPCAEPQAHSGRRGGGLEKPVDVSVKMSQVGGTDFGRSKGGGGPQNFSQTVLTERHAPCPAPCQVPLPT